LQNTGRAGYRRVGLENNPDSITNPDVAALAAAHFWNEHRLNDLTNLTLNRDQFNHVTRIINGGLTGADERWQAYLNALNVLTRQE
jgi:predicted chitinase